MTEKSGFLGLGTAGGLAAGGAVIVAVVGVLYATGTLAPDATPVVDNTPETQQAPEAAPDAQDETVELPSTPAQPVTETPEVSDTPEVAAPSEPEVEVSEPEVAVSEPDTASPGETDPVSENNGSDETASDDEPVVAVIEDATEEPVEQEDVISAPQEDTEPVTQETVDTAAQDAPETSEPVLMAPRFDVVRAAPDGTTLVAGQSTPGSDVSVLVDGVVSDRQISNARGEFVSFLTLPASENARVLSLLARMGDQEVASEEEIILAPVPVSVPVAVGETETDEGVASVILETSPNEAEDATQTATNETSQDQSAVASAQASQEETVEAPGVSSTSPDPGTPSETAATRVQPDPPVEDTPVATASLEEDISTPGTDEDAGVVAEPVVDTDGTVSTSAVADPEPETDESESNQAAVAVLRADEQGVELVQPSEEPVVAGETKLALDTIGYSIDGNVLLSGRAAPDVLIRAYFNNAARAEFRSGDAGRWRARVEGVAPGIYTLRLDSLDAQGRVISRLETPFKRESAETLAAAQGGGDDAPSDLPISQVTVQRGDTLWAISRERYGDGLLFVRVFEANRDAIRNPDLIYPGQIFTIPD